jgi:4'-phosphopantetheinyl transferase
VNVYWLEQSQADAPSQNHWLSAPEALRLASMRIARRQNDWRLGRWTAKCAVSAYLELPRGHQDLAAIEIRAASSGAPEVFLGVEPLPVSISISHRDGIAVCAVAEAGVALGCDLELTEPHSDAFVADYFSPDEQAFVAREPAADRSRLVSLLWSAKESALKALHAGLRLDTRSVIVSLTDALSSATAESSQVFADRLISPHPPLLCSWRPLHVHQVDRPVFAGWWQHSGDLLRTMVSEPSPFRPIPLALPN